ncbi:unnamed protein product [Mucor circinelloides]
MATYNCIYDYSSTSSMEDYLLNASLLLGNQGYLDQLSVAYDTSCGSITTGSTSSSNSCIEDFDFLNPSLSTGMFSPASTVLYNDGVSSSYAMANNEMISYLFEPTSAPTASSLLCDGPSIKIEYDEINHLSPLQQQLQPQGIAFYEEDYFGQQQQPPSSPESIYSTASHHNTSGKETPVEQDQAHQQEPQIQAEVPKNLDESVAESTATQRQKIFACTYCNRTFSRKYDAARHKRIHTGVKPYSCPCCNKGFSRSDARVRHFRTEYNCREGADKVQQSRQQNHNQRCTTPTSGNLCHR